MHTACLYGVEEAAGRCTDTTVLADAARMLTGLNPTDEIADDASLSAWDDSLCEAIRAGEIALADGKPDDELTDDTLLVHASIRAWCERWGHTWPIPNAQPQPVGEAELRQRLDEAHAEADALRVECDALKGTISQHASQLEAAKRDERIATTDRHIMGCMLRLLVEKDFKTQSAVIDALLERFPNVPGLSKRTLEDRFKKANDALDAL